MPEARQNNSKLAEMLARASNFRALVGMAVDVVGLFMALLSFVESAPRAYRLKASTAAPPFSTSTGTSASARTKSTLMLSDLTEIDLEKLGLPLGHRKRLLKAIANLTARVDLAGPSSPARIRAAQDTPRPAPETLAERRQVTVMFSDLVGSTALSARMGPEDLREIISAYQKCVGETVQRFGGFVARYMGDDVLYISAIPRRMK